MARYSDKDYWNARYAVSGTAETALEWLQPYGAFAADLHAKVGRQGRALVVGNGTSLLAEGMTDAGFASVTAIDWAEKATEIVTARHAASPVARPGLRYLTMDAGELRFDGGTFDVVVDKAMLDCCCCGPDREAAREQAARVVQQVHRVLRKGGQFVTITHSKETTGQRAVVYDAAPWADVAMVAVPKKASVAESLVAADAAHYMFFLTK